MTMNQLPQLPTEFTNDVMDCLNRSGYITFVCDETQRFAHYCEAYPRTYRPALIKWANDHNVKVTEGVCLGKKYIKFTL